MAGLTCLVLVVLSVATGVTYFQAILDFTTFPYTFHNLRYSFVYIGLNILVLLFGVKLAISLYTLLERKSAAFYLPLN